MSKIHCRLVLQGVAIDSKGRVTPCCIWQHKGPPDQWGNVDRDTSVGDITRENIFQIYHGEKWKQVRKWFATKDTLPTPCEICSNQQADNMVSFRELSFDIDPVWRKKEEKLFDNIDPTTGEIKGNHIDFLDVRFSNLCNMKCRMCGPTWSSLWAEEEGDETPFQSCYSEDTFNSILELLPNLRTIYFAGGEPLLAKEHYLILEELIRLKEAGIVTNDPILKYNSNCTILKYKNKDLFDLWKHFNHIDYSVSLEHYGERAEYIRHGVDWGTIESNLLSFKDKPNVEVSTVSTVQFYNYPTYHLFHDYMKQDKFSHIKYMSSSYLYNPLWYNPAVVHDDIKSTATANRRNIKKIDDKNSILSIVNSAQEVSKFHSMKKDLEKENLHRDNLRGEDFYKTFPEYAGIFD